MPSEQLAFPSSRAGYSFVANPKSPITPAERKFQLCWRSKTKFTAK